VLDSTGKTPDGILADVVYYCDIMNNFFYPNYCGITKALGRNLDNIIIPRGNTIGFGSFEGN